MVSARMYTLSQSLKLSKEQQQKVSEVLYGRYVDISKLKEWNSGDYHRMYEYMGSEINDMRKILSYEQYLKFVQMQYRQRDQIVLNRLSRNISYMEDELSLTKVQVDEVKKIMLDNYERIEMLKEKYIENRSTLAQKVLQADKTYLQDLRGVLGPKQMQTFLNDRNKYLMRK